MPRVSVIIPTYNRVNFLQRALAGVLAQTFSDLEVVVVDDGSTDGTEELTKSLDSEVRYIRLNHSGVPGAVRNAGLEMARGEYLAFLDSDDEWLENRLQQQVALLDNDLGIGLICSNAFAVGEGEDKPSRLYLRNTQGNSGWVFKHLLEDNFVITSSVLMRRRLLDQVGMFSESPLLRAIEDYDLWLRLSTTTRFCYVADPLVLYRDHPSGIRHQQSSSSYWDGILLILDRVKRSWKKWHPVYRGTKSIFRDIDFAHQRARCHLFQSQDRYFDLVKGCFRILLKHPIQTSRFGYRKVVRVHL